MKKTNSILKHLAIWTILLSACKGPAGDVGPAGPQGAAGTQGIAGAKGDKGEPGAANVFASGWQTVKPDGWFTDEEDPGFFGFFFIDKNITKNLLEKGMFMCYYRETADKAFVGQLPVSNQRAQWNYYLYENTPTDPETGVGIYLDYFDNRKTIANSMDFRWVYIPEATVKNGKKLYIDWQNFEEVKKYLNLKD